MSLGSEKLASRNPRICSKAVSLAARNLDSGLPEGAERASNVDDDNRLNSGMTSPQSGVNGPRDPLVLLDVGEGAFNFAFETVLWY